MDIPAILKSFNDTMRQWELAVSQFPEELFRKKPGNGSWSMSQLSTHLIDSTTRSLGQVEKCCQSDENCGEAKTAMGESSLQTNALGEVRVKNPAHVSNPPVESPDREFVLAGFKKLSHSFAEIATKTADQPGRGKQKHPVLGFLNAKEWLQVIDIHLRHHLLQQARIRESLSTSPET
jgi:hypothetical protein